MCTKINSKTAHKPRLIMDSDEENEDNAPTIGVSVPAQLV
jgi:hypothetical protein